MPTFKFIGDPPPEFWGGVQKNFFEEVYKASCLHSYMLGASGNTYQWTKPIPEIEAIEDETVRKIAQHLADINEQYDGPMLVRKRCP